MYRHAPWKGIKNFFLACSVNDPLIALTTLKATQVITETVQQFRVNCSSAWFKHRYSCLWENNAREQIVSFQMQRKETPISVLFSNLTPSILSATRRHPAPFASWHYWHNHSSCLTAATERFFFSLVMIYYSNEVTEMPAVDFWNR